MNKVTKINIFKCFNFKNFHFKCFNFKSKFLIENKLFLDLMIPNELAKSISKIQQQICNKS